ncbi:MAG: hypothetical protein LBH25_08230 [Fibromonadaceae bacterium]|nr:hypothetical protein [Fibromonadaceae bacterium]
MTRTKVLAVFLCAASLCFAQNINKSSKSVNVKVNGMPPQYTTLRVDTLSRCIMKLPDIGSLSTNTEGRTEYLKRISGTDKNDYVKVWNAKIQLVYQWKYRLQYLVMPQGGLDAQAPVFRETEGTTPVSETIVGDPQESEFFAFSSPRRYYFNTPEAAANSAAKSARQRISELKNLECAK